MPDLIRHPESPLDSGFRQNDGLAKNTGLCIPVDYFFIYSFRFEHTINHHNLLIASDIETMFVQRIWSVILAKHYPGPSIKELIKFN
jgi:hypothetical protein